jgi:3-oxoacid CoA-transferase subunit A
MDKVVRSAADAVTDINSGSRLAVGGFGLCGIPSALIDALLQTSVNDLEIVSNNCGVDDWGLGRLLGADRVHRVVASYVGENKEFARKYLSGELEVELTPQGTLAERMRAGGSGIAAFYTRTGVGTQVADGGLPWRYDVNGNVLVASPEKLLMTFETEHGEEEFVLEEAITADFALVRAWKGDRHGNLIFRDTARNFNPLAAMCGRLTIAEVEELVEPGDLDPNMVHTPGIFVHRVVPLTPEQASDKRIEKVTTLAGASSREVAAAVPAVSQSTHLLLSRPPHLDRRIGATEIRAAVSGLARLAGAGILAWADSFRRPTTEMGAFHALDA